jgi:DNA repair protein RadC
MQTLYSQKNDLFILDHSLNQTAKKYYLAIRDLPTDEKPREKLFKHGPEYLSIQELLSIILNTGTKKEGVLEMSERILKEYGEKSIMSEVDPKKLSQDLNIPIVKASQIVACAELGRRFFKKNGSDAPVIRTPEEVFEYARAMGKLQKEHLRGIYLNSHYKVIHDEIISIGTVDSSIIHPREVFKPAIEYSAAAIILVHNHPSGVLEPSSADALITRQIAEAGKILGIELIDHLIITENSFVSIPCKITNE